MEHPVNKMKCPFCDKSCSKYGIKNHIAIVHEGKIERVQGKLGKTGAKAWNQGLTKENSEKMREIAIKTSLSLKGKPGRKWTESDKQNMSEKMILAHKEGRAWNIGKSRWNNEPSYPEKFFKQVILNEFDDKNFVTELPIDKYSFDFAWPHKKKAIEIDGEQHERFQEYKDRDIAKDKIAQELGWKVIRIKWKDLSNDTKSMIKKAKEFID